MWQMESIGQASTPKGRDYMYHTLCPFFICAFAAPDGVKLSTISPNDRNLYLKVIHGAMFHTVHSLGDIMESSRY